MSTAVMSLVAGEWLGEPVNERRNPARPSELVSVAVRGDASTVDAAVQAAADAQRGWARMTAPARGTILADSAELLLQRREAIARDLVREEGKTLAEATGEVRRAIDIFRYFGSEGWRGGGQVLSSTVADTMVYTQREPFGVFGLITPWNFPIAIPAWKMAPALASGNAVVLKPAEITPLTAHHLATALTDAGLPPGVLNVVHGKGSVIGNALVAHPDVAGVSFTGSTAVGLGIRRVLNERGARVQLEMGGKNAFVVLDDADPGFAAQLAAAGGFGLTGQACTATSRVVCTRGIADAFTQALVKQAERYRPGSGLEDGVLMGPVVTTDQLAQDIGAVDQARADGATVLTEPSVQDQMFSPVVLADVRPDHASAREEIFGPVVSVLSVGDLDEALAVVNDSQYGLSAGICTRDLASAQHFSANVQAGVVKVNRPTTGLDLNVPFGGVKNSSTNTFREQGATAVDFYTWSKSVYLGW